MEADVLYEHLSYWLDDAKVNAYQAALRELVTPTSRVLDLGSGTGLLGLLAARAGAAQVWSYDTGPILGTARELAAANGLADRMHFVQGHTTQVALPEVDLIIGDQIGGLVFDAGVFNFFADAKARSLQTNGALMPSRFEIYAAPVQAPGPYEQVDGWSDRHGFDLSSMRELASNSEYRITPSELSLLADGCLIADRAADDTSPITTNCEWIAEHDGVLHGLSGWFNAQLSPSVMLTNHPLDEGRMDRWLNFYPVAVPMAVESGMPLRASIDIRPEAKLVTWSVQAGDAPRQRLSTFNGQFIFDPRVETATQADPRRAALVHELTTAAVAGANLAELIEAARECREVFATPDAAATFARRVYALLS